MRLFFTIGSKIRQQMMKRGWTEEKIAGVLDSPDEKVSARDRRYLPDGSRINQPATVYIRADGNYVIRNDITGDIVQISDCYNTDWQAPF